MTVAAQRPERRRAPETQRRRVPDTQRRRALRPDTHEHRDVAGGWLRPTVFGAMDGLVSNFALVAGIAAASTGSTTVALAGLAGQVGGAFSMATGEYVSVQSQNELTLAELAIERHELPTNA